MAKNLREGDIINLKFSVREVWEDGRVTVTHPLYSIPITISANEIDEEDVERRSTARKPTEGAARRR